MAFIREFTSAARIHLPRVLVPNGFPQRHRVQVIWERSFARDPFLDYKWSVVQLWQRFFFDPSQWWDHRFEKANVGFPDFKHKKTQESLWLDAKSTPPWVEAKLEKLAPGILQPNIFSWNQRLARFVKAGQYEKTLKLFQQLQQEGMNPNKFSFVPVLNACASLPSLEEGRRIHLQMMHSGLESDIVLETCLVNMYAKCGSLEDARSVFNKMSRRDVVSWNTMIQGYGKCQQWQEVLELFQQMQIDRVEPPPVTFVWMLKACAGLAALHEGRRVHKQIIQRGCEMNSFIGDSLVDMYIKCSSMDDAWRVFNKMQNRHIISWNAMIRGYVKCGQGHKALELYKEMELDGVGPEPATFVGILNACASVRALEEGRRVHKQVITRGFESNVYVGNTIVDMYAKCGSIDDGMRVFSKMQERDVISWNAMILGYVKCGEGHKALELSQQMQEHGIEPNPVTFVGLLNACAGLDALEEGKHVHRKIIQSGCESNIFIGNSLIDMYTKCGSTQDAWNVFNKMSARDVVSWNTMIRGLVKCGEGLKALELSQKMQQEGLQQDAVTFVSILNACASVGALKEGKDVHTQIIQRGYESDVYVGSGLLHMYATCGCIVEAQRVFNKMPTHDVVCWNAMILGHVKCNEGEKALELFHQMRKEGVDPSSVTYVGVVNACASTAALQEGRHIHEQIKQSGCESDPFVGSSLIDMYAKCGSIEDAMEVFNKIPTNNVVSWTAMLGAISIHGHGHAKEALLLFEQMCKEVEVNAVTFVCLLSACNHGGLVDEGLQYFESMSSLYSISPTMEHYSCIIDLLSRVGRLHNAEELIQTMLCEPQCSTWMPLLRACRVHGNVEIGEHAAKRVLELDAENAAAYVLLSDIYASAGKFDTSSQGKEMVLEKTTMTMQGHS